jgi:hypothetical protein
MGDGYLCLPNEGSISSNGNITYKIKYYIFTNKNTLFLIFNVYIIQQNKIY